MTPFIISGIVPNSPKVIEDEGETYINCHMPVQVVFDKSIPLYFIVDANGSTMAKVDPEDMSPKFRKLFEGV